MGRGLLAALLLLGLAGTLSQQAPAHSRQFEVGTLYTYVYETSVLLNEPQPLPVSSPKDVGFRVEVIAEVTPVWQHPSKPNEQILQLTVVTPKVSVKSRQGETPGDFAHKSSRLEGYKLHPVFMHWKDGLVGKVHYMDRAELSVINLMKGIGSLLQHQVKNVNQRETDASGKCDVTYKVVDSTHVTKLKRNCKNVIPVTYHNQTNEVLGAKIDSQATATYTLNKEDKIIEKVTAMETHFLRVEARRQSGAEIISKQTLNLKSRSKVNSAKYTGNNADKAFKSIAKTLGKTFVPEHLATNPDPKECISCKSLKEMVNNFHGTLSPKKLGTQGSAIAFVRLLRKVRESELDTINEVLKNKKNGRIMPQLLDILAAAQTIPAHKAAMSVLKFNGPIDVPERYLWGLSLATHPAEFIIQDLMTLAKKGLNNDKLYETLVLTVGSLTHTFCKISSNCKKPIVTEVRNFIVDRLGSCRDEQCQLIYIRALKNLRMADTMEVLLEYSEGKANKPAIYATRALQTMPSEYITENVIRRLERIFLELKNKHDSSVRAMAADIVLHNQPSDEFFISVLQVMAVQTTKELNTLLLGRIYDVASRNEHLQKLLQKALSDPKYNNYHILGQGGLSSAFSRTLAEDRSANSSFSNMLEINGGLLKRSTVDVFVDSQDASMRLLSIGIFAGGLGVFGGDDAVDDGEEANAGLEMTLMDTQLRPFVFFSGQGELMGHVWAGTGSDRTTALQGSLLLQDHMQVMPLQNGFNAEFILNGAISYDLAGQVQVSLWNRNAHSLVECGAAMVVQGIARVDNSFVQSLIEFNTGGQTQLNFVTDLEFYDEVLMCLQMVQPDFEVVNNVRKLERIPGTNYVLRKYKRKLSSVPGKTYVMNKKNTELCNKMFNK